MSEPRTDCNHGEIAAWPGKGAQCQKCGAWATFEAALPVPALDALRMALDAIPQGVRPTPGLSSVAGWNRYETDDESVLHIWANDERTPGGGQSWDIRLPRAALREGETGVD